MFWLRLFRVTVQPVWILFWKIAGRCGKQGGMFTKLEEMNGEFTQDMEL